MESSARAWGPAGATPATVTAVDGARVDVRSARFGAARARLAVAGDYRPRAGDAVLVIGGDDGAHYVIGVLRALREAPAARLSAADGSSAVLEDAGDGGEVLRVRDAGGRLLFEHGAGCSVVHAPDGDLELSVGGDLSLRAGGRVRVEGAEALDLESPDGPVRLGSGADAGRSALSLDRERTRLEAGVIEARAETAEARATEARLVAGVLRTAVDRARSRVEVVERTAGRIVERAREVYREVEGLEQTRAGRLRLVASEALQVLGQRTLLKAREHVKIKGDKIYLA
ncbi:MAG TPA: DUF3540 domain-containing protein [Sandaracinaceae bacterium LLY-WYZ-13_1]|nr:DUF3540 domain-containing protein [Sandaracinaceae bacterium LLY-WYZ-13_1]